MNKKVLNATIFVIFLFVLMPMLYGCGRKKDMGEIIDPVLNETLVSTSESNVSPETDVGIGEMLSNEQLLSAIKNYCYTLNPNLEGIVNAEEYPVYWDISSTDEHEIVVLFRSYTGAQNRYYIDQTTGDTYVTEYVPGITPEEQRTDESFNVRDYFPAD